MNYGDGVTVLGTLSGVVPLFVGVPREFCGVLAGFEVVELPGLALFN
jgi:hypothetical protein